MSIMNECINCLNRDIESNLCDSCRYKNHKKVYVAIRAAQNTRRWGYDAAMRYCKNRGVVESVLEAALWCHVNKDNPQADYKDCITFKEY